jgi:predicted permease
MTRRYQRLFRVRHTRSDPRDLDEEFRFHLEMRARELAGQGIPAEQARDMATAEFGDMDDARRFCQAEDEHRMRRYRRGLWMDHLLQDLRYAARSLRAARLTTFIAIACIAIGVGGNLAIFTVVRGVLLRPLPFASPESLVRLGETERGRGPFYFSPANYFDVATLHDAFEGVALWRYAGGDLVTSGEPRRLAGVRATGNLMTILGARAALGRIFDARDTLSATPVVVLSDQLWRSEFGADSTVINRSVAIGGASFIVIGVMPPEFNFPIETEPRDYWSPMRSTGFGNLQNRMNHTAQVVGRLADSVDVARARLHLGELARRLARDFPDQQAARGFSIESLEDASVGDVRRPLLLLMGAVGFVFLIACANMASVLLARGTGRRREVVIRTALGATRSRLIRQLMTECALLAICGAVVGLATARVGL